MGLVTVYRKLLSDLSNRNIKLGLSYRICMRYIHQNIADIEPDSHNEHLHQESQEPRSYFIRRAVPVSDSDYKLRKALVPHQPPNSCILKVAILGEPNTGKSTLTNSLVKWKVCAVSKKVHTTRKKAAAIVVNDEKQVVFLDTPGFVTPEHSKKHKLEVSLVADPENSVREADLIAVIIDAANKWTNKRIHEDILEMLNNYREKTSILILNKVDAQKLKQEILNVTRALTRGALNGIRIPYEPLKKTEPAKPFSKSKSLEELFEKTERMLRKEPKIAVNKETEDTKTQEEAKPMEHFKEAKGWPFFSKVFYVSALKGEGVDDLRDYFFNSAKPGDWMYHDSNVTDRHPHEIALSIVKEVLLEELPNEVPYNLQLKIRSWIIEESGSLRLHINIYCPKRHYKKIVIGQNGQMIGNLVEMARQSLQNAFRSEIYLKLGVECVNT